jgi:hypothetical protein
MESVIYRKLLENVAEVNELKSIDEVNSLVKQGWILLQAVSKTNSIVYSLGKLREGIFTF